jgi:hypothetical protein
MHTFVALDLLSRAERGGIAADGTAVVVVVVVVVADAERRAGVEIPLAVVDDLIARDWVTDGRGHNTLALTQRGQYWLGRFRRWCGADSPRRRQGG